MMNLRTGIKTGMAALAIATSSVAGHAQQAAKAVSHNDSIVQAVEHVVAKGDSIGRSNMSNVRSLFGAAQDVPQGMVRVTKEQGSFVGRLYKGGELDGDLAYTTTSKMVAAPEKSSALKAKFGLNYVAAENLESPAGGLTFDISKGKVQAGAASYLGRQYGATNFAAKVNTSVNFPVADGLTVGPQLTLNGNAKKVKIKPTDKLPDKRGAIAPEMSGVVRYNHTFDNGMRVGAEGTVGGAIDFVHNNAHFYNGKAVATGKVGASVGYKGVDLVGEAGKDVHLGKFATAGFKFNF